MSAMVATQVEVTPKHEVTPEELLDMPDGGHFELIDGELMERRVSILSNLVGAEVTRLLGNHCQAHDLGWIFAAELGYQCFPWLPKKVRRADVSFIRHDRCSLKQLSVDEHMAIPPDLAVEVVSPNDRVSDLDEKLDEYLRAGVQLVWVINPEARTVQVFRQDGSVDRLRAEDELSGEDVLPGFRCKVAELFPKSNPDAVTSEPKTVASPPAPGK